MIMSDLKSERIIYSSEAGREKLPLSLFSACKCHRQESIVRQNGAPFYQILVVLEGEGSLRYNGEEYRLFKGCGFYVGANVPIEYIDCGGLVSTFVTAVGSGFSGLAESFGNKDFLYLSGLSVQRYGDEIARIVDAYHGGEKNARLSALTYSFFVDFFENGKRGILGLEEVFLYIERNFDKRLTLERLAAVASVSVSGLCHGFKRKYGKSVIEHLLGTRLSYARMLLLSGEATSVKEAALSSGFEDFSYFCRAYKKHLGKTPTEDVKRI